MIKRNYKLFLLFSLIISFLVPIKAKGIAKSTEKYYVNDYANVISTKTEKYINEKNKEINEVDGTEIVVVTINKLNNYKIEDYALKYFTDNKLGDNNRENGILILISVKDKKSIVLTGNGFETIFPQDKTLRLQNYYMIPYLKEKKWDEGIKNGFDAFYSEIVRMKKLDLNYTTPLYINSYFFILDKLLPFIIISVFIGSISGGLYRDKNNKYILLILVPFLILPIISKHYLIITITFIIFFIVGYFYQFINDKIGWLSN